VEAVLDMNDRALRDIVIGLGGTGRHPAAGRLPDHGRVEVMAIFALARTAPTSAQRLGRIILGYTRDLKPVRAPTMRRRGAMTLLLKDALAPNLVQTLGGVPALHPRRPVRQHRARLQLVIATRVPAWRSATSS
jgi:formate--tetrahydrofolate ligase